MAKKKETEKATPTALDLAIASFNKDFGQGTVFRVSGGQVPDVPKISYGSLAIDAATSGAPKGRIIEIYGPESSGKTTICLNLIREGQQDLQYCKEGRTALIIDVEHALDLKYATEGIGVDENNLIIAQPSTGEDAMQIAKVMIGSGLISVCVIDSVSALLPKAELEGDMGDSHMGLQSRLMSQSLRTLTPIVYKTNSILIFTNQIRHKIGITFGNPETTSGGNALKFYASQRLDIRRSVSNANISKDPVTGHMTKCSTTIKVVKNKVFPPFRVANVDMEFGIGINNYAEVLDFAVEQDIIPKGGAWYSFGETKVGGRDNAIEYLKNNPALFTELHQKVRDNLFPKPEVIEKDDVEE